jgi:UDP-N-acetylmuramoyl-L-alanyl-D-glutamate--2,6-diaminopimelate ligase
VLLQDLFAGVDAELPAGAARVDVRALAVDSRRVGPGALFAALAGVNADGTDFAVQAVEKGAAAVLAGRPLPLKAPIRAAPSRSPPPAFMESRHGGSRSSA